MDAHEFAKWAGHFDIASITVPTATPTASASKNAVAAAANESAEDDKVIIGLTAKKETDFKNWYRQLLIKAEMLEYYDVSGCYVLRPNSYSIWEYIQQHFDAGIKKLGVRNCYFPMFVTEDMLQKEKDHIEGFAPEVAWVTKAGQSNLDKPVAIRPTSETVMYPTYAKWIKSWRDLPLRLNQWCNVVRWEFKNPLPFIRTREFLWQEGHTAFATKAEADVEVRHILQLYADVYEQLLAVPMMQGIKSHKEKFAGGLYTTTIEGFVPSTGRGIQAGTSHCLGQNFANMFDITFLDDQHQSQKVWQNSWGLSTRTLGVLCMIHGDNKGLVLPPRVAHTQVVVMPVGITARTTEQERLALTKAATDLVAILNAAGVRATDDCRTQVTPGYKFNHWELRGIPIRLEIGPRDLAKKETRAVRRDTGEACNLSVAEIVVSTQKLLDTMQSEMLARATAERDSRIREIMLFENGFVEALNAKCMVVSPWCNREACEDWVKDNSARQDDGSDAPIDEKEPSMGAKTLCLPFAYNEDPSRKFKEGTKCFACDKPADLWALWGRSY
ncbi:hypothetical protein CXG81DRAFT_15501 [Caulochytrium protostelioides]|uniref:proline--tRNA ligase n=1 Tax=Caulochytrium protostelioides TaxID=1555241 RepID=A0A4P9WVR4_9FUNG|nr:prolyl-tRNA synthetase [Caulochytrium protostelioides]RKO98744.1 hypothetical protein CXG81DRAFT_15501 [Caulochytrium protostelioides]|eukprot:RKO98744.1 hypothetical protein CXG81DRAFT_15501 [Caulochytrium protostelioides]